MRRFPTPIQADQSSHFDTAALSLAFAASQANPGGMTAGQYFRITIEIMIRAPANLIIFGAGADTALYVAANPGGRTVVLEHHRSWRDKIEKIPCEVVPVVYTSLVGESLPQSAALPGGLPSSLLQASWDLIQVDSPEGHTPEMPGRSQSIYAASQLRNRDTCVFLHDFNRPLEEAAAIQWLGKPREVVGKLPSLAIF